MPNDKIISFSYLKGADFTGNLKHLTQCKDFKQLSQLLDIPKSTFSTWNSHQRTQHEVIVRLHLALGIPVKDLALVQNNQLAEIHPSLRDDYLLSTHVHDQANIYQTPVTKNQQHTTVILKSYALHQGQLIDLGDVPYAVRHMNYFHLKAISTLEVETDEAIYLVNQTSHEAISGRYLIEMDGHISIHFIQRLPGNKLNITLGPYIREIDSDEIKVLGHIVSTLKKDDVHQTPIDRKV